MGCGEGVIASLRRNYIWAQKSLGERCLVLVVDWNRASNSATG